MHRFLIVFLFLGAPNLSLADEENNEPDWNFKNPQAKKALNGYKSEISKQNKVRKAAIKKLDDEAKKARKKHRLDLIMSLEKALKKSLQDANLEEAKRIDAVIKALKKGAELPSAPASHNNISKNTPENRAAFAKMLAGTHWTTGHGDKFIFNADHTTTNSWHKEATVWVVVAPYQVKAVLNHKRMVSILNFDKSIQKAADPNIKETYVRGK